jgi:hypothetical protein
LEQWLPPLFFLPSSSSSSPVSVGKHKYFLFGLIRKVGQCLSSPFLIRPTKIMCLPTLTEEEEEEKNPEKYGQSVGFIYFSKYFFLFDTLVNLGLRNYH